MRIPSLSAREPRVVVMAATLAVVAVFSGVALASAAVGPGTNTDSPQNAGPPGNATVTATPTPTPSAETLQQTETPTDDPETVTVTDTDTPTDDPVTNPAGDPPTDTDTPSASGNEPPDARMYLDASVVIAGLEAHFGDESSDPDGEIVSYEWDLGDGTTTTGDQSGDVRHTYESGGEYTVTLTVTDDDGATDTVSRTYTVEDRSHYPRFQVHGPDTASVEEEIRMSAGRSYPQYPMPEYEWDFGDGETSAGDRIVTHTYDEPGNYTVTVTGTGPDGRTSSETLTVTVTESNGSTENQPPEAGMPTAASVPVRIDNEETFIANQAEDPDGEIVSYEWEFGDGETATGERVSHTYDELGDVEVTVTVTDDDGATDTATQNFQVVGQLFRPTAAFSLARGSGVAGQESEFLAESANGSDGQIVRYEWDFGDGTTASGQNVTHTFDSTGTYNVTLEVTSSDMLTDTVSKQVRVTQDRPPEAHLWFEPDTPVAEEPLRYSVDTPGFSDEVSSYEWDFDDGTTATGQDVEHAFESNGTYNVTVTVTTTDGRTITDSRYVEVRPSSHYPLTDLCYEHSGASVGEEIEFRAMSTPPQYANADTIEWDFGDGATATGREVTHAYDEPGIYNVSITKTVDGESNTVTESIAVESGTGPLCTGYQ